MKDVIKFLMFIVYSTSVFFFPNNEIILVFVFINIVTMFIKAKTMKKIVLRTFKIFPFILFTFVFNWWLDNITNALWIGAKLLIVCNATMIYSSTISTSRICRNNKTFMYST